jgi:hypothetical protein
VTVRRLIATFAVVLLLTVPAFAADWVVLRLRGGVEVMVDGNWVPLKRGDVVGNEQVIRTLADGHADLQRDMEVMTLGSNTEIRIRQDSETGYTTVLQDFGRVEVDAEARRVKHFEVQTPYLAAVVKGTHFIVNSDSDGATVTVDRGAVSVQSVASERITTIKVGQIATVMRKSDLVVSGLGPWPPVLEPGVSRTRIVSSLSGHSRRRHSIPWCRRRLRVQRLRPPPEAPEESVSLPLPPLAASSPVSPRRGRSRLPRLSRRNR